MFVTPWVLTMVLAGAQAPKGADLTLTKEELVQVDRLPEADRAIALASISTVRAPANTDQ